MFSKALLLKYFEEWENNIPSLHELGSSQSGKCLTPMNFNSNESFGTLSCSADSRLWRRMGGMWRDLLEMHLLEIHSFQVITIYII